MDARRSFAWFRLCALLALLWPLAVPAQKPAWEAGTDGMLPIPGMLPDSSNDCEFSAIFH